VRVFSWIAIQTNEENEPNSAIVEKMKIWARAEKTESAMAWKRLRGKARINSKAVKK
jgi:hypothetical protein